MQSEELRRRKPVWLAFSELYLDTELDDQDLLRISHTLQRSGYTREELDKIHYEEVAPVVGVNLLSSTGVWSGFDEKWLVDSIVSRKKQIGLLAGLQKYVFHWMTADYFKRMRQLQQQAVWSV